MNYAQAMTYLADAKKRGSVPGLDAVRNLLKYLGNPQDELRFVHIAGTNGKGSTTAMIASILQSAGYTVGRYTSPEVFDDREKYVVNGQWITEDEYAACMEIAADAVARMEADGLTPPTSFEIETALAMLHFVRSGCDIVALETGMGGALDATNIVSSTAVCVLTAIGMDHMKFLGSTLKEIALHKAGIIKPGSAVVLHRQSADVIDTVAAVCREKGVPLTVTAPDAMDMLHSGVDGMKFRYRGIESRIPLTGRFQLDNAAGAIEAALLLRAKGFDISDEAIADGLKNVSWPGRLQKLRTAPDVYIDGAHNPNAAARLAEAIELLWPDRRLICVMGVLADKDFDEVARLVCSHAAHVITVTPHNPRALNAGALCEAVRPHCPSAEAADSAEEALAKAIQIAGEDDVVLAFGSLSYLKDIVSAIQRS